MRRFFLVAFLFLFACGDARPGGMAGAGGAGGRDPGGSGGTGVGGAGGDEAPDLAAPEVEILFPNSDLVDPDVTVFGVARDDRGVARLAWRLGDGPETEVPVGGGPEEDFAFDLVIEEGENDIVVAAADAAGNTTEERLAVRLDNPAGRAAAIQYFDAERPFASRGEKVRVHWRITGTRPLSARLHQEGAAPVDVAGLHSREVEIRSPTLEWVHLEVTNHLGTARETLGIGVGEELRIYPLHAKVAPGEPQALRVTNVPAIAWSADRGTLLDGDSRTRARFVADEPGVYTVVARTLESPPRTATATIEVREARAPVQAYEGRGGQLTVGNDWYRSDWDGQGRLWVPIGARGFAVWSAADGWRFVGDDAWPVVEWVIALPDGALLAGAGGDSGHPATDARLLHLPADGSGWALLDLPPSDPGRVIAGPDGTLYRLGEGEDASLLVLAPGAGAWMPIELPGGMRWIQALAIDADGAPWIAFARGFGTVVHRHDGTGWFDTGATGYSGVVNDLHFDAEGTLHLAGSELLRLGESGWESVEIPFACTGALCNIVDLADAPDGTLLALRPTNAFARQPDGTFAELGTPIPEMIPEANALRGLDHLAVAADGTVAAVGIWGVFALPAGATAWEVLGTRAPPPGASITAIVRDAAGGLLLASGGPREQHEHELFWSLSADGSWSGFGASLFAIRSFAFGVSHVARAPSGEVYACLNDVRLVRLEPDGTHVELPRPGGFNPASVRAFEVGADGTLYVALRVGIDRVALHRLPPGSEAWEEIDGLDGTEALARGPDGTIWASDGASARALRPGSDEWEVYAAGLHAPATEFGDVKLAVGPDDTLYLAHRRWGLHRLRPGADAFEIFGAGAPASAPQKIAIGAGRVWVVADGRVYLVDGEESALPVDAWLPFDPGDPQVHLGVDADGHIVLGTTGLGLLRGVETGG